MNDALYYRFIDGVCYRLHASAETKYEHIPDSTFKTFGRPEPSYYHARLTESINPDKGANMLTSEKTATDIMRTVYDIVEKADAESQSPSDNLVSLGRCLVAVGEALADVPVDKARRVIKAVAILHDIVLK